MITVVCIYYIPRQVFKLTTNYEVVVANKQPRPWFIYCTRYSHPTVYNTWNCSSKHQLSSNHPQFLWTWQEEDMERETTFSKIKLLITVLFLQLCLAGFHIVSRTALDMGVSKIVFPVYRNIIALALISPFAYFLEK
jgi:hypothetical protein